jgi:hypothetical protein
MNKMPKEYALRIRDFLFEIRRIGDFLADTIPLLEGIPIVPDVLETVLEILRSYYEILERKELEYTVYEEE